MTRCTGRSLESGVTDVRGLPVAPSSYRTQGLLVGRSVTRPLDTADQLQCRAGQRLAAHVLGWMFSGWLRSCTDRETLHGGRRPPDLRAPVTPSPPQGAETAPRDSSGAPGWKRTTMPCTSSTPSTRTDSPRIPSRSAGTTALGRSDRARSRRRTGARSTFRNLVGGPRSHPLNNGTG